MAVLTLVGAIIGGVSGGPGGGAGGFQSTMQQQILDATNSFRARQGLDLERCTAYSDSANDLPMLTMVGTPVAINPDATLRSIAAEHGWQVSDYRSLRKAVRAYGLPALATAAFSYGSWRFLRRSPKSRG